MEILKAFSARSQPEAHIADKKNVEEENVKNWAASYHVQLIAVA
jgi:hypothetical protein